MKNSSLSTISAVVLDVETTGFSPYYDEIIELGMVLFTIGLPRIKITTIDQYSGLRQPGCKIHPRASLVNGITMSMVQGKSLDLERVESILEQAQLIIAHNAAFDKSFTERLIPSVLGKPWYCSMRGIDWYGRGFYSKSLPYLLREHSIAVQRAHRAQDDAMACLKLISQRPSPDKPYILEMLGKKPLHLPREHHHTIKQIAAAIRA